MGIPWLLHGALGVVPRGGRSGLPFAGGHISVKPDFLPQMWRNGLATDFIGINARDLCSPRESFLWILASRFVYVIYEKQRNPVLPYSAILAVLPNVAKAGAAEVY